MNAWNSGGSVTTADDLRPKLESCRASLTEWSLKEFKHNLVEINKVKQRLRSMVNQHEQNNEVDEERALKSRLHALWKREEIYWKHRSRVRWL